MAVIYGKCPFLWAQIRGIRVYASTQISAISNWRLATGKTLDFKMGGLL